MTQLITDIAQTGTLLVLVVWVWGLSSELRRVKASVISIDDEVVGLLIRERNP